MENNINSTLLSLELVDREEDLMITEFQYDCKLFIWTSPEL